MNDCITVTENEHASLLLQLCGSGVIEEDPFAIQFV